MLVWTDSVMDQACNDDAACKSFVARKNCQSLLTNYYNGDYSGSKARISSSSGPLAARSRRGAIALK